MSGFIKMQTGEARRFRKTLGWYAAVVLLFNVVAAPPAFAGAFGENLMNWLLGSEAQAARVEFNGLNLDLTAQQCVNCHNGSRASHITVKDPRTPIQFSRFGTQINHSVGMNYDSFTAGRSNEYTRRESLDSNIVLVDGNVSCVSCHLLREETTAQLFMETDSGNDGPVTAVSENCSASGELTVGSRQTDLCLACHIK